MAHLIPNTTGIANPLLEPKPKAIFVMRFRSSMGDSEFGDVKDRIYQSDISKEYHIIALKNDTDRDEFEMYNADKLERQSWNQIVNKIIK